MEPDKTTATVNDKDQPTSPPKPVFSVADPPAPAAAKPKPARTWRLNVRAARRNRCVGLFEGSPALESYKILRTKIQHRTKAHGWNTVMITSVRPAEGKTLTAINLALTFAREFHQTALLVDCDLKRQSVHKYLGLKSKQGLVDYLQHGRPLPEIIIRPGLNRFSLISGGGTVENSAELLNSPRMGALVREMKTRYADRFVIFDSPPILGCADALALFTHVDCLLMVVEAGRTTTHELQAAMEHVPAEKFLGFVLNRQNNQQNGYYGHYGYYR